MSVDRSPAGSLLRPVGATTGVTARSVLVVAPHFDDEILGCGGLIAGLVARGSVVRVLFLSDGSGGDEEVPDRDLYATRRRAESRAALAILGVSGADYLALPDGGLAQRTPEIAAACERALLTQRPDLLLAPSPCEVTPDHRGAFLGVHAALQGVREGDPLDTVTRELEVYFYEVNHPLYPNVLVDVSAHMDVVGRAMAEYRSQEERHPYWQAALGLRSYRALSLAPGHTSIEAYRRVAARDLRLVGPRRLIRELGGLDDSLPVEGGPLVSVIVRTKDRPRLLAEALLSLEHGSYRRCEIVLVNDGGAPPELPPLQLPVRRIDLPVNRGRAAAANAGLAAASGDFVSFLDDDDIVEPDHLEVLAGFAGATGSPVCYSDAAVGIYETSELGWRRIERRLPYSRDFDGDRLLVDNYIPFHTLLIDRRLALRAGPLDVDLPFFEDWEFLLRLAEHSPFRHLRRVTCEYRVFRGATHHVLGEHPDERADFRSMKERVLRKHHAKLDPARLARIVDDLRREQVETLERANYEAETRRAADDARNREHGELLSLRAHVVNLEADARRRLEVLEQATLDLRAELAGRDRDLQRLYDDEERLRSTVGEQEQHLGRVYSEITRLRTLITAMESTRAWRVHRWWESKKGR